MTTCAMGELLAESLSRNSHQKLIQLGEPIRPFPNGTPAAPAAQVVKLSHRAILFGCTSNDDPARLIIEYLHREGVITDGTRVMNNAVMGMAFVSYQNSQQWDFAFNILNSACGLFTAEYIDKDLLKQCNHSHTVDSSLPSLRMIGVMRKAVTTTKSASGTVPFDPSIRKEVLSILEMTQTLDYLIEYMDIFIPSEGEPPFFAHHKNLSEKQTVSDLLHDGVKHVAIKHTQCRASYYKFKSGTLHAQHVASHDIEVIDPAGVGDCSGITLIILFLSGFPAHKALQCANASGVLAVTR